MPKDILDNASVSIDNDLLKEFDKDNQASWYDIGIVKNKGYRDDLAITQPEMIAQFALEEDFPKGIKTIERKQSYKAKHDEITIRFNSRPENNVAKLLVAKSRFGKFFDDLGMLIDYEVPIKGKNEDKAGKIDLLSYSPNKNTLYLIEFKWGANSESILRCAMEISTYFEQIDREKLIKDFSETFPEVSTATVKKAILVPTKIMQQAETLQKVTPRESSQYRELKAMRDTNANPSVIELINKLDIELYTISDLDNVKHFVI